MYIIITSIIGTHLSDVTANDLNVSSCLIFKLLTTNASALKISQVLINNNFFDYLHLILLF